MDVQRSSGDGWLALIGGGEFSFGETLLADRAWLAKTPEGPIGFLPTASGSADYGRHFAAYLGETFQRDVETVPIYGSRDARRGRNLERIEGCAGLYLGGGVADELIDVLADSPALEALLSKLRGGGVVAAIGAAAQALGKVVRGLDGESRPGLLWLPKGVIEGNFDPGHDRRLRQLAATPGVSWGMGLPAGSALLMGPKGEAERVGTAFELVDSEGDLEVLPGTVQAVDS